MPLPRLEGGIPIPSTLIDWTTFFIEGDPDDDDINGFSAFVTDTVSLASGNSYTGLEIQVFGRGFVLVGNLLVEVAQQLDIARATGQRLVTLAKLNNVDPNPGQRSIITLRWEGVGSTDISARRYRYTPNGTEWLAPADTIANANGVVEFEAFADEEGAVEAKQAPASQWEQVQVRADTNTVESVSGVTLGVAPETQDQLRARANPASITGANQEGIKTKLQNTAGVTDVDDSLTNRTLLVNADGINPKSIEWVVEGGTDQDVASTLLTNISSMTMVGNTTVAVDGFRDDAIFTRPTAVRVQSRITLTEGELGLPANVQTLVATGVAQLIGDPARSFPGLGRGLDVKIDEVSAAALTALGPGRAGSIVVELRFFGGSFGGADLVISKRERAETFSDPQPAIILGTVMEPFDLLNGWNLDFSVNAGPPISAVMTTADFEFISVAKTSEVAEVINNANGTNYTASVSVGRIDIRTTLAGPTTSIQIRASSETLLLAELGLIFETQEGTVGDIEVIIV